MNALALVTANYIANTICAFIREKNGSRQCYRPLAYFFDSFYTYASLRFTMNVLNLLIILSSASV